MVAMRWAWALMWVRRPKVQTAILLGTENDPPGEPFMYAKPKRTRVA